MSTEALQTLRPARTLRQEETGGECSVPELIGELMHYIRLFVIFVVLFQVIVSMIVSKSVLTFRIQSVKILMRHRDRTQLITFNSNVFLFATTL